MSSTRSSGRKLPVVVVAAVLAVAAQAAATGCPADFDGSGDVDFGDLLSLISAWGSCPGCPQDIDDSGDVGFADILSLVSAFGPCPSSEVTSMELAGNPLDQYPWFEFVRAFNEAADVSVAINPDDLDGPATADVYVVEARTEAEWGVSRTLVDIRGGAQTVTFSGATIQANTVTLTGSSSLSATAGTGFGVGYDIVCDFNQNGTLDTGDFIDGLSDQAGCYVIKDPTTGGPLAVSTLTYSVQPGSVTAGFEGQRTYYPTVIGALGELPLITISHGNGHQFTWYDYLGVHLASYGFIVMSHANNTGPGIETASTTTYEHTDAFLGQLDTIGGGALVGHVDTTRIIWIGHSRGGEGVARAFTRVSIGQVTPANYTAFDVILVSSIAPNNSLGPGITEPGQVPYHLLWGAADGDISGSGTSIGTTWSFAIFERAEGFRQSTYVHGADHNDFNCCGFDDFEGVPGTAIGRAEAQQVAKGVYLPLVQRYARDNAPALDTLWRQYERFRPPGVAATTTVVSEYRDALTEIAFAIDDHQDEAGDLALSSSGGVVIGDVQNRLEGLFRDGVPAYDWDPGDPMNGMSRARTGDDPRGAVFDWSAGTPRFLEYEVVETERDFTDEVYLSFRACQGTQHPETTAILGDLSFTVSLRDASGTTSSIDFAAYGGGIEEPYQRSGGWQNEFETIRIRLRDFLHDGSGLDLANIVAVRLDFGDVFGAAQGRIGFDDLILSSDPDAPRPGRLTLVLLEEPPALLPPGVPTDITVAITGDAETLVPDSARLHYRYDGGIYAMVPLAAAGGDLYTGTFPPPLCGDAPEYFFTAQGTLSGKTSLPDEAPSETYTAAVGVVVFETADDFETDTGWVAANLGASSGDWERGVPVDDDGWGHDPVADSDGSGQCYLTQNEAGNTDVDGGAVRLTSPVFDMSAPGLLISYDYYLKLTLVDGTDRMVVEVNNGTTGWRTAMIHDTDGGLAWRNQVITGPDLVAAGAPPSSTMQIRYTVFDGNPQSVVEAALDAFEVYAVECE